ncbi:MULTISPECIES: cation:proton antiporter [unclassified Hyphomonas]|jgi:CPA2 family monovalent cation:H+ antiporter-2|uniref:cation:proton antiporter domain-containing protein n=3 Tax=Hyphomonas TaxID=85 RepID=UPI000E05CE1E|nr:MULTISPECIES: cation:proton antiporter [unclassified Hyphomonas]MBO6583093.1 cation:proton antiporter [Hyphomonas sp.]MDF1805643.1 cation:proton antiporter [Hyphomonas sp.]QSR21335.1 potassium transporter KefB [Hyphomonas sp. KY3]RCL88544.1 MAG: potassium transporter KefB [Hyphomonas sp.]|tara:strand:- start:6590 stop:8398 length:1809 start_codon:yes stop_codon:yes gene_type:complete
MAAEMSPADAVGALVPAITLLGFGAAAALVSRALNLSPIVGYLLAGILIGPGMLNLIHESGGTHLLAELGVVFLLFDIGMHVSLRELKESRGDLLGLAPVHLLLTGLISAGALYMLGISWPIAIAVGLSLGLSSTAVVARILTEREQNSCPIGRTATHVLIFQDIVAIFLMIFATSLGEGETAAGLAGLLSEYLLNGGAVPLAAGLLLAFVQALIAFGAAMLFSRYLLNPVFRTLAATRNDEAFTAFTLLLVLAAACATAMIGLSLTLGAFLAGLAVSGTPFRHQVQTEMGPFRGLLLSFFFISVGLSIDLPGLLRNLPLVVIGAFGILTVKTALGYIAARMNGWSVPGATQLATLLAQGSEFTLVILSLASITANMPPALMGSLIAAIALSLALAPSWAMLGGKLSRELARRKQVTMETSGEPAGERPVIVIGMSAAGRLAVDALIDFDIPYIATDGDPDRFLSAVADGYNVSFGDAANMKLIEAVGGSNARAVVLGKARYEVSKEVTPSINRRFPDLVRLVAVETIHDLDRYLELNIRAHLVAGEPKGIEMVADMLRVLGVPDKELADWLSREADLFTIGDASDRQDKSDEEEAVVDEAA